MLLLGVEPSLPAALLLLLPCNSCCSLCCLLRLEAARLVAVVGVLEDGGANVVSISPIISEDGAAVDIIPGGVNTVAVCAVKPLVADFPAPSIIVEDNGGAVDKAWPLLNESTKNSSNGFKAVVFESLTVDVVLVDAR